MKNKTESILTKPYACMEGAEYHIIVARGSLAFRFGPFTGPDAGKIMEQGVDEGVPFVITINCGPVFDWELARDFTGGKTVFVTDLSSLSRYTEADGSQWVRADDIDDLIAGSERK